MKITIAYLAEEEKQACAVVDILRQKLPGARTKQPVSKDQYSHIYLTTRKPDSGGMKP